ncbi:MAG: NADAR family protein [Bacteroidia bacterium]|nr:NADAR family protein [Bacteroidia bacterium]
MDNTLNLRQYNLASSVVFKKTREAFGGLSNMAGGYPILVNGIEVKTSEALYQAARFPHDPEVQRLILAQSSPMSAKMKAKGHIGFTRTDWNLIRSSVMYWALKVKLANNFLEFGKLLEATTTKDIVELSRTDKFWAAIPSKENPGLLVGVNALGRLLMKLREEYNSDRRFELLVVTPPNVSDFLLLGQKIEVLDYSNSFYNRYILKTSSTPLKIQAGQIVHSPKKLLNPTKIESNIRSDVGRQPQKMISRRKPKSANSETNLFSSTS